MESEIHHTGIHHTGRPEIEAEAEERAHAFACVHCGGTEDFWAWYDQPERQSIRLDGIRENGTIAYDYTGCTDSGDEPGPDTSYYCGACGNFSDSLEALVGLPEPPHVSTLAELFTPGQLVPELDSDDFCALVEIVMESAEDRAMILRVGEDLDLDALKRDCGYDEEEESSVDSLIAYKDALEDIVMEYQLADSKGRPNVTHP